MFLLFIQKILFFSLCNSSRGPGTISDRFGIKKYPGNGTMHIGLSTVEKLRLPAFQRRYPRLKPICIDPFQWHVLISTKRHNIGTVTLNLQGTGTA